ncbi:MAG: type II secretion system F family protein [Phycisphaerae bacterium]|nr:type II secretion system F family protein [Phycisphaerae bacterium]
MPVYRYQGVDPGGKLVAGTLTAESLTEAAARLRDMGLDQAEVQLGDDSRRFRLRSGRVQYADLIEFNGQLAAMARAGIPLDRALAELVTQMRSGRLREAIAAVADDVHRGVPLADAMDRHGDRLPPAYVELVRAGMKAGNLPELLLLMNQRLALQQDFRRQMIDAFVYPSIIILIAVALSLVSLTYFHAIVQQTHQVFESVGFQRRKLSGIVEALPFVVPGLVGGLGIVALLLAACGFTRRGRRWRQAVLGLVPYYRRVRRINTSGQLCSALAMFLRIQLPLPEALRMAARTTTSEKLRDALLHATADIERGTPLRDALDKQPAVPRVLVCSASIGEARGDMPSILEGAAEMYRRQGERALALARVVLPLVGVVLAGLAVGSSALALLSPMIRLLQSLRAF